MIDFGIGDPRRSRPTRIKQALVDGLRDRMGYPAARGLARAARGDRRVGAAAASASTLDPDTEVIPTLGSKEAIFSFAQVVVDIERGKDTVAYTEPGYPVYERGALFAHARALALPLLEENGFLPDLDAIDEWTWNRAGRPVGQLPEQPHRRDCAARLLRAGSPSWRASMGSCLPPTRRTRSSGSTSRPRLHCSSTT